MAELEKQTKPYEDIEVLALYDNKKRTVGEKRNALLSMANGLYVSFLDDDDSILPTFVEDIHAKLDGVAQVVNFIIYMTSDFEKRTCFYSTKYKKRTNLGSGLWFGPPSHIHVWLRSLVVDIKYPPISLFEDAAWADIASKRVTKEVQIRKLLYLYKYSYQLSETRRR